MKIFKLNRSSDDGEVWINLHQVTSFIPMITVVGSHLGTIIDLADNTQHQVKESLPDILRAAQAQIALHESGVDVIDVAAWSKHHSKTSSA